MRKTKSYSLAFLLSLVVHSAVGLLLLVQPQLFPSPEKKPAQKVSEVELIDAGEILTALKKKKASPTNDGQIVEQNEKRINDEKSDARFLSRHDQKVVRETQAQLHGRFKNTDESAGERQEQQVAGRIPEETSATENAPLDKLEAEKDLSQVVSDTGVAIKGAKPKLKDLLPSFKPVIPNTESPQVAQGGGEGASTTDDHLKNVQTGMQTLLSTREFVYYSYYNRIKAKLRQYWEPKIKEKMERIMRQGRSVASDTERTTRIIIILDSNGVLQRIQVVGASGVHDLDDAAVEAFRAAAPFPNPPKGIQEADGTIKIRWDFILEANASGLFDAIAAGVKTL